MTTTEEADKKIQQKMEGHPHLLKVYKDKIGKLSYGWAIATGGNFQVDQAFMVVDGDEIEMPGDWVVTIKDKLVIVTCDEFIFSRRTPVIVKPWKKVTESTEEISFLGNMVLFEDCDGLGWTLYEPRENPTDGETRKSLTAEDQDEEDCLVFYLQD